MSGQLCAVLLNPPTTTGSRTRAAVQRAADHLGYETVVVANLVGLATTSSGQLADVVRPADWRQARRSLRETVAVADGLLFGWGLLGQLRGAQQAAENQVLWLVHEAVEAGHSAAWAVGEVRHPSRWHQYTADRHGRTEGGSAQARLGQVLRSRPLAPVEAWLVQPARTRDSH